MSDELEEAWAAADEFELLWHRAREGARGARKGLERIQARNAALRMTINELRLEVAHERSLRQRAEAEKQSLVKKIERLSLRLISSWGERDANDARR